MVRRVTEATAIILLDSFQRVILEDCHAVAAFAWLPEGSAFVTLLHDYSGSEPGLRGHIPAISDTHLRIFDVGISSWVHTVNMQPGLRVDCFAIDTHGHTIGWRQPEGTQQNPKSRLTSMNSAEERKPLSHRLCGQTLTLIFI